MRYISNISDQRPPSALPSATVLGLETASVVETSLMPENSVHARWHACMHACICTDTIDMTGMSP